MIFEFLKRLFGKADECRKRKATEVAVETEDVYVFSKRQCHDFDLRNNMLIDGNCINNDIKNGIDKVNIIDSVSYKFKPLKNDMTEAEKSEDLESLFLSSSVDEYCKNTKYLSEKDYIRSKKYQLLNQSTLYTTHSLTEKKQYNKMLLNFFPHQCKKDHQNFAKTVNQEQLINKNLTLSTTSKILSSTKNDYKELMENHKEEFDKYKSLIDSSIIYTTKIKNVQPDLSLKKLDTIKENFNQIITNVPAKLIKTNTLRQKFSHKEVLKEDFISQITKRYNERVEHHYKEVEELKKMTYILSKHNQLTREANLEEYLHRSMRLCEAVLDERDLTEELELKDLSPDIMECVRSALSTGFADEVLVEEFGLRITKKDIQTLAGLNWLNDEVINFYMNLLIIRGNNDKYPSVYAMNTFFYPKLISGGHSSLKRWTRKVDIFSKDLIVVPIHLGIHWCMSIIDFRNKSIRYYDSMGSPNYKCLQVLKQYIYDESIDKKNKSFDFHNWNFECMKNIPQQMNSSDCGVFSCMFAEYICSNKNLNFSQENMPFFRNKMVYEIISKQIL